MQHMQMCHGVCATAHAYRSENNWVKFSPSSLSSVAALHSRQSGLQASSTLCLCSPSCHSSTELETCYPGWLHACIEVLYSPSHLPSLSYFSSAHSVLGVTIHCNKVKARFNYAHSSTKALKVKQQNPNLYNNPGAASTWRILLSLTLQLQFPIYRGQPSAFLFSCSPKAEPAFQHEWGGLGPRTSRSCTLCWLRMRGSTAL